MFQFSLVVKNIRSRARESWKPSIYHVTVALPVKVPDVVTLVNTDF